VHVIGCRSREVNRSDNGIELDTLFFILFIIVIVKLGSLRDTVLLILPCDFNRIRGEIDFGLPFCPPALNLQSVV
jgi:hypothetical protein